MIEEHDMGSQTLEILRQGMWASLTGGWFYDPHQDVFCNTFHLYLWLFLLCLPFTIYMYFPPVEYLWYFYCTAITAVIGSIKLINYSLHHMYDTGECMQETVSDEWSGPKREDEGIELQILNPSTSGTELKKRPSDSLNSYVDMNFGLCISTDVDSLESGEYQRMEFVDCKQSSTIDLKADVHRKNSSESSEEILTTQQPDTDSVINYPTTVVQTYSENSKPKSDHSIGNKRHQANEEAKLQLNSNRKMSHQPVSGIEVEETSFLSSCGENKNKEHSRRHSNFTNSSLSYISAAPPEMKATGSLELDYLDNYNQPLTSDGFYFRYNNSHGVRRIRSTALESTASRPSILTVHPNSLEIIGGSVKTTTSKNPLPPPSTTLTRNQHLNLCPYYGSEIVYPIAEQSDEHQTSHGPDTDVESMAHVSDSDYDENTRGSRSPLLLRLQTVGSNPHNHHHRQSSSVPLKKLLDVDRQSATSKDALLLDNENSNSSVTPDLQEEAARRLDLDSLGCGGERNEIDDKKLSDSSCCDSTTSLDCCDHDGASMKVCTSNGQLQEIVVEGVLEEPLDLGVVIETPKNHPRIKRTNARRNIKKKPQTESSSLTTTITTTTKTKLKKDSSHCSSLVELDLDWLFDDENVHVKYTKDTSKHDWCGGRSSGCVEEDVSKVLQETIPAPRSLGAIPKKRSEHNRRREDTTDLEKPRKLSKSESDRSTASRRNKDDHHHRHFHRNRSVKENRNTQQQTSLSTTKGNNASNVEGLECLVQNVPRHRKMSSTRRTSRSVQLAALQTDCYQEAASSSGSNNELSTLLPPPTILQAFLVSRREFPLLPVCLPGERANTSPLGGGGGAGGRPRAPKASARVVARRRWLQREAAIATTLSAGHGTHCAKNFNDTSDGSVHCFLDEHGNWVTYTFDEKGIGTANLNNQNNGAPLLSTLQTGKNQWENTDSIDTSVVSVIMDAPPNIPPKGLPVSPMRLQQVRSRPMITAAHLPLHDDNSRVYRSVLEVGRTQCLEHGYVPSNCGYSMARSRYRFIQAAVDSLNNNYPRTKTYYKYKLFPFTYVKVTMDRLKLLALLDRNLTMFETIVAVLLGILVSIMGSVLLHLGFYEDISAFVFCFIIASSQYSLMKSVQPDAASPTHGFNRVIAYSRPIYFCLFTGLVLLLNACIVDKQYDYHLFEIYGASFTRNETLVTVQRFLVNFVLFFPLLFSLGLFPQVNTFLLYVLEQVDMHVFGGNAMSSLSAAFYCVFRSVFAVIIIYGLAYGGLCEPKGSQHILFSMFCACLVSCSYHLSRSASDPSHVWNMLKKHLWPPDIYKEHRKATTATAVPTKNEEQTDKEQTKSDDGSANGANGNGNGNGNKQNEESEKSNGGNTNGAELVDPLPKKLRKTVNARLASDVLLCGFIALLVFGIHASTVFTALRPELSPVLWGIAIVLGFLLHYVIPQLRKQLPWLCIARPVLRSLEFNNYFYARGPAQIMWFERIYVYLCFLERNLLYPLLFLSAITEEAPKISDKFGTPLGTLIVVICGLKCLRSCYSDQSTQYLVLTFSVLFFKCDYSVLQESFLVDYFIMGIVYSKVYELLLKVQFVVTYIAPWQITWGSAFHAFAQPFSVPHSAMLFTQAIISAILSTPLNPFLGSAIFLTSYVRPVKFWERDYNTRRVDHSNTPLSSHLERNLGADDNNLNSIFYEHLTRCLQHSLCGDLILGRWGAVNQGDCFVLASDYLNCLVHIIELGNGLVTFQMRGLEFRGTYCQQREVEAITEEVELNDGCCCCDPGHLPHMLSINAAFSQRWLAWEVSAAKYILEGYSISDNSAVSMLQMFDFRKVLVTYYVKSIIFYAIRSQKLREWLKSGTILKALEPMQDRNFVDLDPLFNMNIDEDFDLSASGMTRTMFYHIYSDWIAFCVEKSEKNYDCSLGSTLVVLCFALSLLGRRTLGAASHNTPSNVEFFLYGLHALFKGDFRITCARDEWVFTDMDLLKTVVAPGVRMSLKLHQDHFMSPEEYLELGALYEAICKYEEELVISHEGDPAWRNAVLSGTQSLLALRHVLDEGNDEYKIIMLNKRFLCFRVIKINKECVRGLWAGQQQELVYLRNRNPERGSIQNAKQALRNIINSSCDQPIGYPIYVSPLTTSYAETNDQLNSLVGGSLSLGKIKNYFLNLFRRIRKRCGEGCSSGGSARDELGIGHEGVYAMTPITTMNAHNAGSQSTDGSHLCGSIGRGSSLSRTSLGGNRGSLASMGKPTSSTLASLAGLFKERDEKPPVQQQQQTDITQPKIEDSETADPILLQRVKIVDPNLVYDAINLGRRIDVSWPNELMRSRGGRSHWKDWLPEVGMEGLVVHKWSPCHKDVRCRSHVDRTILLVQIDDKYIPIAENGIQTVLQSVAQVAAPES